MALSTCVYPGSYHIYTKSYFKDLLFTHFINSMRLRTDTPPSLSLSKNTHSMEQGLAFYGCSLGCLKPYALKNEELSRNYETSSKYCIWYIPTPLLRQNMHSPILFRMALCCSINLTVSILRCGVSVWYSWICVCISM